MGVERAWEKFEAEIGEVSVRDQAVFRAAYAYAQAETERDQ